MNLSDKMIFFWPSKHYHFLANNGDYNLSGISQAIIQCFFFILNAKELINIIDRGKK
jgi:hypothetical protein